MGAQDEYLRDFCILLTDKGVVPLTDPLQISVYNSLLNGMKRPSDLTTELNLSSSSLHFIIDKMSESGIIDRIKPESDKKTVYYSTSAKILASSTETNDKLRNISEMTFVDPLKNYKGLSSLSNMLDCYMSEIGVNMDPIKMKYARSLADAFGNETMDMEDAVMDVREKFSKLTGYNFTVYSFSPFTLVMSGDENTIDKAPVMLEFITRMVENRTGKSYRLASIESFNGSETMVKVVLERSEKMEEPYMNTSMLHRDSNRFMMVDVDGTAGLMTSSVQIDIIDTIYERPLCITDIVNKVDSPRSTITSNLLRMVEEGVISVFYSESGSAYYGLACSILLKKSRPVSSDNEELSDTLDSVKDKENGFFEGQLLYTLAYFRKLGFDSEYIMVVLGAKYMRASGSMDVQGNFDTYFGKMSDIAQAIGLSLSIVSVYPLTIGITSTDPKSEMSQAMTFIKGMAHQGLEMASSGIFVRSTEEREEGDNVSFREIYPALSMKPVKGVMVENLSPTPAAKKRTSSVKTALLNRSKKENGQPTRTVRYITAAAFLVMLSAVLIFGVTGSNTDADTVELSFDDSLDISVYDAGGNMLESPYSVMQGTEIVFKLGTPTDCGYVEEGIAYLMTPGEDGAYSLTMKKNLHVEPLFDISELEELNCPFLIYSSDKEIEGDLSKKFITADVYKAKSNGLYVSAFNKIQIFAGKGYFVTTFENASDDERLLQNYVLDSSSVTSLKIAPMPQETRTLDLGSEQYYFGDQIVTGVIQIDADSKTVSLKKVSDDEDVVLMNGTPVQMDHDGFFTLDIPSEGDIHLTKESGGLH